MTERLILSASFIIAILFAAPSLALDFAAVTSLKDEVGKILLISCIVIPITLTPLDFDLSKFRYSLYGILYTLILCITFTSVGQNSSTAPILGAGLKVSIFFILVSIIPQIHPYIKITTRKIFSIILILSFFAFIFHNVLGFSEITRLNLDNHSVSVLFGSFSTSRIYIGDLRFYRISSIFYEPGNFGFILYLILIYYTFSGFLTENIRNLIFINMASTFSLGLYISMAAYSTQFFKLSSFKFPRTPRGFLRLALVLGILTAILYFLVPALSFVFNRLGIGSGEFLAGDNRFYDDTLPENIWLGEGGYGGGFDSIISIIYQYGILGSILLCTPVIFVSAQLFFAGKIAAATGLVLFLAHKPNILTPIMLILLALISYSLSKKASHA